MRIKGWMGRADQTTKVKGMFVHPSQVTEVVKRHPQILRARLTVSHDAEKNDTMSFQCEIDGAAPEGLATRSRIRFAKCASCAVTWCSSCREPCPTMGR